MTKEQTRIVNYVEETFLKQTQLSFGANLSAVILYGSAITEVFTDGVSDVNVLIILDKADPGSMPEFGKKTGSGLNRNRVNPLFLTKEEYLGSADIFPLEYMDIVESRRVLFGEDPTESLDITVGNLRHQIEGLLRGTIAELRRALLSSRGRKRELKAYVRRWLGSQNPLLRGILRLGGVTEIPGNPVAMADAIGAQFGVKTGALTDLYKIRNGEKQDALEAVKGALVALTELAGKIDSMDV